VIGFPVSSFYVKFFVRENNLFNEPQNYIQGAIKMKIFVAIDPPVKTALEKAFFDMFLPGYVCGESQEADLIIVDTKETLQKMYDANKHFVVLSIREETNLPANARWIPILDSLVPMLEYVKEVEKIIGQTEKRPVLENSSVAAKTGFEYAPGEITDETRKVLVVDDKPENLQSALELLNKKHFITLASGFDEGLKLVREGSFDVVLSDCQMLPETENSSLSIEGIVIGQTVHNGIFLIFHATMHGARVAIVTDANHHRDWVSALFDDKDLRQPQEVNGQPVLLINYMGKRWDEALNAICAL
jgi:hypothetical protein